MYPDPHSVTRVASIGGGPIGGGWTAHFLARGYDVTVNVNPTFFTQGFRGVPHEIQSDMVNGYPKGFKHG